MIDKVGMMCNDYTVFILHIMPTLSIMPILFYYFISISKDVYLNITTEARETLALPSLWFFVSVVIFYLRKAGKSVYLRGPKALK